MARDVVVVSAGLGQPSTTRILADRIADALHREVSARGEELRIEVVELREHARGIADAVSGGFPAGALAEVVRAVEEADGLVMASPVFTASYSGLFKSFVDVLDKDALRAKPVLIAATAGTPRHSLVLEFAMRPLFAYLGSVVVPTGVFAATDDFGGDDTAARLLASRVDRAAEEMSALLTDSGGAVMGLSQRGSENSSQSFEVEGSAFAAKDRVITPMSQLLGDD